MGSKHMATHHFIRLQRSSIALTHCFFLIMSLTASEAASAWAASTWQPRSSRRSHSMTSSSQQTPRFGVKKSVAERAKVCCRCVKWHTCADAFLHVTSMCVCVCVFIVCLHAFSCMGPHILHSSPSKALKTNMSLSALSTGPVEPHPRVRRQGATSDFWDQLG